jgi:hypothetical protein
MALFKGTADAITCTFGSSVVEDDRTGPSVIKEGKTNR